MTDKPVLLVVHQLTSDPGRIGRAIARRGYRLDVRCCAAGYELPPDLSGHAAVVVFGGPMSANDDHLAFLRKEMRLIERALKTDVPFLGVCLGHQMMARVLGGRVVKHPAGEVEIGYWPIRATEPGKPLFGEEMTVYQWHREGVELPAGAGIEVLARSERFDNQAFRVGSGAYGIQFHVELTTGMMQRWLQRGRPDPSVPGTMPRAEQLAARRRHDADLRRWLDGFIEHWMHGAEMDAAVPRETA
ncbi:glutamine amidotransferase-related protein [Futiania mangrovi]|uniref:Gamma-glutamyl-gamma-aminobutyrate hydrolase family protein n=1 Tax=Futiania mangrovi TaxID=2959716 RepID=A0A9J6PFM6_9PROT|nr:gamma-glutamyl-gamma-aminobutyrate hydrolase family protein [Futiania mangrovii]MCP1336603.1 gamma-glutamyl-gamma-aminobutyrate hydrolase family protein [Futiania mangrovii]